MPVYNHVKFVREAVESILKQTYQNFELILVDDGSTDGSSKILKEYASRNKKIKYFHKNNGGTGSALNLGFSHATGKYGTWVSSDNIYYPEFLQILRNFLEEYVCCGFVFSSFSLNGKRNWYPPSVGKKQVVPMRGILRDFLDRSFERCITGICYLFRMTLKRDCGEYISIPGEDYVMGIQMGIKTQIGYTPESLGMWREHPNTVTQQLCLNKYKLSSVDASGRIANQIAIDLVKEAKMDLIKEAEREVNKKGWMINDCLTCIPGTRTFWHDLLGWFPSVIDKTNGYTPFGRLADYIESEVTKYGTPDFIIRNATYFRKLNFQGKTISFLQDCCVGELRSQQIDVCNHSDITICNSSFTKSKYENELSCQIEIIPIGTDFDLFKPLANIDNLRRKWGILENSILFVGSTNQIKGFSLIEELIQKNEYNFCLVMKDDYKSLNPRVRVFNKINHQNLVEIMNCCKLLLCTSLVETLHLAGIEAGACNIPILVTNVGAYFGLEDGIWGRKFSKDTLEAHLKYMIKSHGEFSPRDFFLKNGFDKNSCFKRWKNILSSL